MALLERDEGWVSVGKEDEVVSERPVKERIGVTSSYSSGGNV